MKTLYVCNNHEKEKSDLIIMEGKPFISEGTKGVNIDIVELEVY